MINNTINLLTNLIEIPSVSSNKAELHNIVGFVEKYLANTNLKIHRFESNEVPSLLITNKAYDSTKPLKLLFNAHIDVVPAPDSMFKMSISGNKAFGRGVYDMKGAAAAMISIFKTTSIPDGIGLQLVTDEEIGGINGAKYQLEKENILCDFFFGGEPTNLNILHAHKGIMQVNVTEQGKAAHGSRPWEGINANVKLAKKIVNFYDANPIPDTEKWETTYALNELQGGVAMNVISPKAVAKFDIRYVGQDNKDVILNKINKVFTDSNVEMIYMEPGMTTDTSLKAVQDFKKLVEKHTGTAISFTREHFATDARFYSAQGVPSIHFGVKGGGIHQDSEYIELDSLILYENILREFINKAGKS